MQQSFLTLVSIAILTTLTLNFYRSSFTQSSNSMNNEGIIAATGIGQSLIEEIKVKAFDEVTVAATCTTASSLTAPASLGAETGETNVNLYDDIDDFHNYTVSVPTSRLGDYNVRSRVYYIVYTSPDAEASSQTFTKRVDVNVTNSYMQDTVKLFIVIGF